MGFFRKNKKIVDLGERYKKQQERAARIQEDAVKVNAGSSENAPVTPFSFFDNSASSSDSSSEILISSDEKKRKLAKRLSNMTEKIEDLSNQIYHLQQRIEVLERKSGVGGF